HRDVKPANLLLDGGEPPRVMLGDFGIAKMTDATAILTGTGAVMGSIDFMSPEQINGRPADVQSDVYAFGCTLFTMLAARAPFEGDNFERLYARLRHQAPPLASLLPDVPPALDVLCQRLMQRDPAARAGSLEGVADVLRAV
ncbi:MAG: serine/threonine protein kinase, partial [Myxococcales bacterium]|nr:serine/threonine protein kinase [Myxococcales bacterium]